MTLSTPTKSLKDVNKIDDKLNKIYENQVTTNVPAANWVDRSQALLDQMNFIALNNKSFLNVKEFNNMSAKMAYSK